MSLFERELLDAQFGGVEAFETAPGEEDAFLIKPKRRLEVGRVLFEHLHDLFEAPDGLLEGQVFGAFGGRGRFGHETSGLSDPSGKGDKGMCGVKITTARSKFTQRSGMGVEKVAPGG